MPEKIQNTEIPAEKKEKGSESEENAKRKEQQRKQKIKVANLQLEKDEQESENKADNFLKQAKTTNLKHREASFKIIENMLPEETKETTLTKLRETNYSPFNWLLITRTGISAENLATITNQIPADELIESLDPKWFQKMRSIWGTTANINREEVESADRNELPTKEAIQIADQLTENKEKVNKKELANFLHGIRKYYNNHNSNAPQTIRILIQVLQKTKKIIPDIHRNLEGITPIAMYAITERSKKSLADGSIEQEVKDLLSQKINITKIIAIEKALQIDTKTMKQEENGDNKRRVRCAKRNSTLKIFISNNDKCSGRFTHLYGRTRSQKRDEYPKQNRCFRRSNGASPIRKSSYTK